MRIKGALVEEAGRVYVDADEHERADLRRLAEGDKAYSIEIKVWRADRSVDQNSLYWPLVRALAGATGGHYLEVHEAMLAQYGTPRLASDGRVLFDPYGHPIPKRSRELDRRQFHDLVEGVCKELAEAGVHGDEAGEMLAHVRRWRAWDAARLFDDQREGGDYRSAVPYCEALCGALGEDLAHIASRGAHGEISVGWNLLHLCHAHHMDQHATGIQTWASRYEWLEPKIKKALARAESPAYKNVPAEELY